MTSLPSNSVILKAIEDFKECQKCLIDSGFPLIQKVEDYVREGDYEAAFQTLKRYTENKYKYVANLNFLSGIIAYKIIEEEEK